MSTQASPQAISRLAALICQNLNTQGPLLAVSVWYQTGHAAPALYLAYETADHAAKVIAENPVKDLGPEHVMRQHLGPLFDPGWWKNPADPVLSGVDASVDAWTNAAFGAIVRAAETGGDAGTAYEDIRAGLWAALDEARCKYQGVWPPVSFVRNGDDAIDTILNALTTRREVVI